ncbi:MAG: hypothetical protein HY323_09265 [Betaproteobacteria bacterium]|nr:hypothetical protein [Betaproteobacteria bacterium]
MFDIELEAPAVRRMLHAGVIFAVAVILAGCAPVPPPPYVCLPGVAEKDGQQWQVLICELVPSASIVK